MSECWKWGQAMLKAGEDELGSCEGDILKIVIVGLTFNQKGKHCQCCLNEDENSMYYVRYA